MDAAAYEISWLWDRVPVPGRDAASQDAWTRAVVGKIEEWSGEKVAETAPGFPLDSLGTAVADALLARAADLPRHCRLYWGAGFLGAEVRWMPVLVVAEFRQARPGDSSYLMAEVGTEGRPGDIREPVVEYVSTEHGDGVRVFAVADLEGEGVHGRVNAALRLERPDGELDVLLSTRVTELGQLAAIGPAVESLMHLIAAQTQRFVTTTAGSPS